MLAASVSNLFSASSPLLHDPSTSTTEEYHENAVTASFTGRVVILYRFSCCSIYGFTVILTGVRRMLNLYLHYVLGVI